MQLLSSSFPNERLLTTYPVKRMWWVCHSKPTIALQWHFGGVVGSLGHIWDGGKVGRTLGLERPVPHLGLHCLAV